MDDIAHVLWSIALFYHYDWWLAAIFGVLPDLVAFIPFYARRIILHRVRRVQDLRPKLYDVSFYPRWVSFLYNATHSIFVILAVIGVCSWLFSYRVEYWAMLIHVLVDIPSHRRQWFGTKILWPFSHWQFDGVSWASKDFMLANYTAIALVFGVRLFGL